MFFESSLLRGVTEILDLDTVLSALPRLARERHAGNDLPVRARGYRLEAAHWLAGGEKLRSMH